MDPKKANDTQTIDEGCRDNLILIGMPGAGKSTLGVVLAKVLGMRFLDVDLLIQDTYDTLLHALINMRGNEGFIELEGRVLNSIKTKAPTVISTGGSAVYSEDAMEHLRRSGKVIYLRLSRDELAQRLGDLQGRGVVVKGCDETPLTLDNLLNQRLPLYEKYADAVVDVSGLSIMDAVAKMREAL